MRLDEAYRRCEEITAAEARNFSYGIKLLPGPKRQAMSALYALARRIDDIGDGDAPAAEKLDALARVRKQVADLSPDRPAGGIGGRGPGDRSPGDRGLGDRDPGDRRLGAAGDDPVLTAMADVCRRYPIPLSALDELIEGCEMDVIGTTYATFDELVGYCRRVAGTVGRLSLAVYGSSDPVRGEKLADDLGVALQVTNILRDIVEDRTTMGRVYLPGDDLRRFGIGPDLDAPEDDMIALIEFEAARAEEWYERGLELLPLLDRRSRACTAAMAGIYRRLLTRIRRDPAAVLRGRVSLPAAEKTVVAFRALTVGRP